MSDAPVTLEISRQVAKITSNKSQRRNALDDESRQLSQQICADISARDDIRIVLLAGEGENFCAGADIHELREHILDTAWMILNYMRTGQYYLNRSGPYSEFFPEVLEKSAGRFHVDYAYHLAPIMSSHIDEIDDRIAKFGVTSFKIFMFYGGHGLHGASNDQSKFLMAGPDDRYDFAHFEFIMHGVQRARERFPHLADSISLGLHCETAEIMRAYTNIVEREGKLEDLKANSAARPPHLFPIMPAAAPNTSCTADNMATAFFARNRASAAPNIYCPR